MREMVRELAVSVRQSRQARYALVSLTLAIGLSVGANLAILVQLHDFLAPANPFPDPSRLFVIENTSGYSREGRHAVDAYGRRLSRPDFDELVREQRTFVAVGGFNSDYVAVMAGADRPRTVCRIFVAPRTLEALGASPALGRSLGVADFHTDAPNVALLTDAVWRRYFDSDASIVGRSIQLDEQPFSVIGVLPANVAEMLQPHRGVFTPAKNNLCVITPLLSGSAGEASRVLSFLQNKEDMPFVVAVGRLSAEGSQRNAAAEASLIGQRLRQQHPGRPDDFALRLVPLASWHAAAVLPLLTILGAAAGLTLLVAGANASGLLMAESLGRAPEFATRMALGAPALHLVRVVMLRAVVWTSPGGLVGLVLAEVTAGVVRSAGSAAAQVPNQSDIRVLLIPITALLTLLVAVSSGIATLWTLGRQDLSQSLRENSGQGTAGPRGRIALVLLTVQVAAAISLALGAGLLLRSIWLLGTSDYGFDPRHGFVVEVRLPRSHYTNATQQGEFFDRALLRVREVPGVDVAAFSSSPPFTDTAATISGALTIQTPGASRTLDRMDAQFVSSGYFEALGMTLLRGRFLSREDERGGGSTLVVDETFCRNVIGGENPLASVLWFGRDALQIVGVVRDARHSLNVGGTSKVQGAIHGMVYLSLSRLTSAPTWRFLVARTLLPSPGIPAAATRELRSIDPSVLVGDPTTFGDLLSAKITGQRRLSILLTAMACVVLLLMGASLTAALSQLVTLRSREIAIRYCLGAGQRQILALALKYLARALGAGCLLGVSGGLVLGRVLASQVYGITSTDLPALATVLAILLIVGVIAAIGPLRRLLRIDPAAAMRAI